MSYCKDCYLRDRVLEMERNIEIIDALSVELFRLEKNEPSINIDNFCSAIECNSKELKRTLKTIKYML